MSQAEESKTEKYASNNNPETVKAVYDIAIASYEGAQKRVEAIDQRLTSLMAWFTTVYGVIATIASRNITCHEAYTVCWLFTPIICFTVATLIVFYGLHGGNFNRLNPKILYHDVLFLDITNYREEIIRHAGYDFQANFALVKRKYYLVIGSIIVYLIGLTCLLHWVYYFRPLSQ